MDPLTIAVVASILLAGWYYLIAPRLSSSPSQQAFLPAPAAVPAPQPRIPSLQDRFAALHTLRTYYFASGMSADEVGQLCDPQVPHLLKTP